MISHMLGNLHHALFTAVVHSQGILDIGKLAVFKFYVYNRSHNLQNFTNAHASHSLFCAFAPAITSVIS